MSTHDAGELPPPPIAPFPPAADRGSGEEDSLHANDMPTVPIGVYPGSVVTLVSVDDGRERGNGGDDCGADMADGERAAQARLQQLFDHGVALMLAGERDAAIGAFRDTLVIAPWLAQAHINLGLLLSDGPPDCLGAGELAEAEEHYRAALALDPERLDGYLHLGVLLAAHKRFGEAEALYRAALAVAPQCVPALSNLGVLLACSGREDQARACYHAALAIDPSYDKAHFNLAYLLLRQGQFAEGWRAFEHRPWYGHFAATFQFPRWSGQPLNGKNLLIGIEAGHGDMIQFCRYAALARQAGAARIGIVCHPGLRRLLQGMPEIDSIFSIDAALPSDGWDYWTPPLSMPFHFGTRIDSIPATLPYLFADPSIKAAMAARLQEKSGAAPPASDGATPRTALGVGLVWQGNPRFENDADRSLSSLSVLAPLFRVSHVRFFSLQKGPGELSARAVNEDASFRAIEDMASLLGDFADTAALIDALDLVITVDTAVAHLAGALGKPCWVLLPAFKTDWRWMTGRADSPWYPGAVRLFRQTVAGDWSDVVKRVHDALKFLAR